MSPLLIVVAIVVLIALSLVVYDLFYGIGRSIAYNKYNNRINAYQANAFSPFKTTKW